MLNVDTAGLEFLCSTVTPDLRMRLSAEFCRDDIIFEPSNIDVSLCLSVLCVGGVEKQRCRTIVLYENNAMYRSLLSALA